MRHGASVKNPGFPFMSMRSLSLKIALIMLLVIVPALGRAAEIRALTAPPPEASSWISQEPRTGALETRWGGQIKFQGSLSWVGDESIFQPVGAGEFYDGNIQGRLKNKVFFGEWGQFDTHYEVVLSGGDTRKKSQELKDRFPGLFTNSLLIPPSVEDDRRFLDLTKTIHESNDTILYHRLDRLALTLLPKWGVVRIGRQAVTWGNGLVFNPMDLFNPFSPTDVERDYKIGDDMISLQTTEDKTRSLHFLYVPRRDPATGDTAWSQSSLAGMIHLARGTTEFDIMAARHFEDVVIGVGGSGYLGDALWRLDGTFTFSEGVNVDYLSLVANLDYSWVWWEKNIYGFLEFFYNGLGGSRYGEALVDPVIRNRLERGDLFVLGRVYLSGHIQIELHPLFNVFFTVINNLADPSGILQPRAAWDVTQNIRATFGANLPYGGRGTEFGGFRIPGNGFLVETTDSVYLWLTYFF